MTRFLFFFAQNPPVNLSELIPIVAIFISGLVAVAFIMAGHQRKMAEMMRQNSQSDQLPDLVNELKQMRSELQVMRGELHQTTIAVDDIRKHALPSEGRQELHSRMTEEH